MWIMSSEQFIAEAVQNKTGNNAGKRSITLDLTQPEGRALLHRLVPTADVIIETYPAAVADRLGLGPETLAALQAGSTNSHEKASPPS